MPPLLRYFWFHSIYSLAASCSLQSAVCSLQSAVCSLRSAVCSLQSAVCSLQSAVCNLRSAVCSLQSAVCGLQSAVCKCHTPVAYRAQESYLLTHFHSNDVGFQKIGQLYACSMLDHFTVTSFIVPFDTLNLFPFLTKIMLINTSQHKSNMIYIIKQEGLRQNKANSSLVCTRYCEMDFFRLFHTV